MGPRVSSLLFTELEFLGLLRKGMVRYSLWDCFDYRNTLLMDAMNIRDDELVKLRVKNGFADDFKLACDNGANLKFRSTGSLKYNQRS
jgi:hypothetical protein